MAGNRTRFMRIVAAVLAVLVLSAVTSVTATAKTNACKKGYVRNKAKRCVRKAVAKKTTTKTTAPAANKGAKGARQISAPAGSDAARARPSGVDPDGELSIAWAAPPNSLDPDRQSLMSYTGPLYDRLTRVDDTLTVRPMLATGWSFPNKSTFEMTLRNDVTFEDGTKFDAAAVKANIERSKTLQGSSAPPG